MRSPPCSVRGRHSRSRQSACNLQGNVHGVWRHKGRPTPSPAACAAASILPGTGISRDAHHRTGHRRQPRRPASAAGHASSSGSSTAQSGSASTCLGVPRRRATRQRFTPSPSCSTGPTAAMATTTRPGGSCAWSRDPNRARRRFLGTTRLVRNAAPGSFRRCGTWHRRRLVCRRPCIARTNISLREAAVASTQDGMLGTRGAGSAARSVGSGTSVIGSSTQSWKC